MLFQTFFRYGDMWKCKKNNCQSYAVWYVILTSQQCTCNCYKRTSRSIAKQNRNDRTWYLEEIFLITNIHIKGFRTHRFLNHNEYETILRPKSTRAWSWALTQEIAGANPSLWFSGVDDTGDQKVKLSTHPEWIWDPISPPPSSRESKGCKIEETGHSSILTLWSTLLLSDGAEQKKRFMRWRRAEREGDQWPRTPCEPPHVLPIGYPGLPSCGWEPVKYRG